MNLSRKLLCLLLSFAMLLTLASCGGGKEEPRQEQTPAESSDISDEIVSDAEEESASSSEESTLIEKEPETVVVQCKVAVVTDQAEGADVSLNERVLQAGESYCKERDLEFTHQKVKKDTDEARIDAVKKAVKEGNDVIVLPGARFSAALEKCSAKYPKVKFIGVEMDAETLPENACCLKFQEELPGFMAGYMAVKQGYTKLGFLGTASDDASVRYGFGFLQGADCAAVEDGALDSVNVEYAYAEAELDDATVTQTVSSWYHSGTEVVFAASRGTAVAQAASGTKGKVIGADYDQASEPDQSGKDMTLTSAVKNVSAAVNMALGSIAVTETWTDHGGKTERLGVVDFWEMDKNYVGLASSSQWTNYFTEDDYEEIVKQMISGDIDVLTNPEKKLDLVIQVNDNGTLK